VFETCKSDISSRKQEQWTRKNIKDYKDDPFWRHTGYIIAQMDGLYAGAMKRAMAEGTKVRCLRSTENLYDKNIEFF
jgi:hypothetical protein